MRLAMLPVLAALLAPLPAGAAPLLDATDPQRIANVMSDLGYRAKLETDREGDPMISSAASGVTFSVFFYGCTDGADCRSLQFRASFDLADPTTAARMNQWNRERRFGKAFIDDEGDPYLEMNITLDGGVSEANFADAVDWWEVALGEFLSYIEW